MRSASILRTILGTSLIVLTAGCSGNPALSNLGSTLLSSTGLMSQSQADSLMKAGGQFAEAARPLSDEQEYYLGRSVAAMILGQYRPVRDDALHGYVNRVAGVVSGVSDRPETFGGYHVLILDSDEVNAMSAPGGFIFISRGLLNRATDEDTLAAIIAHEVAHVVKDHGTKAISRSHLSKGLGLLGKEALSSTGNFYADELTGVFGESVNDVFQTVATTGYSRSQEYDADEYAAELLTRAGYNPKALITMLKRLEAHGGKGGWYATHPSPEDRVDEVEGKAVEIAAAAQGEQLRAQRFKKFVHAGGSAKA